MRVFVTGGSGFVGGHVVERLARSHEVVALARSDRARAEVERLGARAVPGDLATLGPADLGGADAVVHCAALTAEWGTREEFWSANVEGTARVLAASREAGVQRFIHIGTEAALFDGGDLVGIDEVQPYPLRHRYLYSETKAEAERRVLAANSAGLTTVSLRPRLVWGPRDTTVLAAIVRMVESGGWMWIDGGRARTSTTHVANVAAAVELALTRGSGGRAYFVADDGERTMREFFTELLATQGVVLPKRSLPGALLRPLAAGIEGLWRTLGIRRTPPMTRFAVDMMSASITVRSDRARAELGYLPVVDVAAGMAELRALHRSAPASGDPAAAARPALRA